MICTSIQYKSYEEILDILQDPHVELAEIRLDRCDLKDKEIEELFSETDTPLIATCRIAELARTVLGAPATSRRPGYIRGSAPNDAGEGLPAQAEREAERRLSIAIQAGARFADLELEASADFSKRFRALCHECGTEIIRSWHDFEGTPDLEYLKMIQARCYRYGADIAKIVTTCRNASDAATILALYGPEDAGQVQPQTGETAFADGVPPRIGETVHGMEGLPENRPEIGETVQGMEGLPQNEDDEVCKVSHNSGHLTQNRPKTCEVSQNQGHLTQFGEGLPVPGAPATSLKSGCIWGGGPGNDGRAVPGAPATSQRPGYIRGGAPNDAGEGLPVPTERLIAFGMGQEGRATRIECLKRGAPFTYACLTEEDATAPGQIQVDRLFQRVYAGLPAPGGFYRNDLEVPASKSFAQRAIIAAALAEGRSHLRRYTPCGDSESAIAVARAIGARVRLDGSTLSIDGIGACLQPERQRQAEGRGAFGAASLKATEGRTTGQRHSEGRGAFGAASLTATEGQTPEQRQAEGQGLQAQPCAAPAAHPLHLSEIHAGESGLLTRLLIPLLAVLNEGPATITGEKTLSNRPLKGVSDIMASFGVLVKEHKVPITVHGNIIPGTAEISGKDGSQLISGLLMALPFCAKPSTLLISDPKSIPYMFITCDLLKKFGIRISSEMEGDAAMIEQQDWSACTGITFKIKGGQKYHAADIDLEGDWSAAANFLVAGAIFGNAEVHGLETDSIQADLAIADIIVQAGAIVSELDDAVCVSKAPLEGFEADLNNAPDLFPIVSILAAFSDGMSRISGLGRLVGKESNRAEAILDILKKLGVNAQEDGDDLLVWGENLASRALNGRLLKGGKFSSLGDHRLAMALKIASIGAAPATADGLAEALADASAPAGGISPSDKAAPIVIDDPACVAKSFPDFFESFDF